MIRAKRGWRVVYGETRPMWERIFPTKVLAEAFAKKHRSFGDIIFAIGKVVPGELPQSITAAIEEEQARDDRALLAFANAYVAMAEEVTNKGADARPTLKQLNMLLVQARAAIAKGEKPW